MQQQHEYAVLGGFNRTSVGRYMTRTAAVVSGLLTFLLLQLFDFAKNIGIPKDLPPIALSLVGASTVYAALYWIFDRYLWRWNPVSKLLRIPDITGNWVCKGETVAEDGTVRHRWDGTVKIVQTYDKIQIRLNTAHSGSSSITAALQWDDVGGYHLLYNYRNDPKVGSADLHSHRGCADMVFDEPGERAEGEYFNGVGRDTFGRMIWIREC